jgi:hypothetical protein
VKSAESFWARVVSGWSRVLFLCFVFGFVVRLIPEVLASSYPTGYDPIYYVWVIKSSVVWSDWSRVFSTWLLYAILVGAFNVTRMDPFVLVKFAAALLFGFNVCGIYYFATKALGWTIRKGLLAAVFFSFQMAALAFSANFYRNMLGLGILLFALPLIKNEFKTLRRFLVFALLSVLVVFAHEYGSVILFTVVLGFLVNRFLKRTNVDVLRLLAAVLPALALFLVSVYFMVFPVSRQIETNIIGAYAPTGNYPGVLFFLKNYLANYGTAQYSPIYLNLASQVLSLFASLFIVVLPLVLFGFFKDDVLNSWTVLLLIGSFGVLVTPFFALEWWYRWMLMLVYPFTFYAANGVTRILQSSRRAFNLTLPRVRWAKLAYWTERLILILPLSLGLVFMATNMQGTAVPLRDVDDTIGAIRWLNAHMDDGSALLVHDAFSNWARLYLDKSHVIIYFEDDVQRAIDVALQRGFSRVYFVWLNENIGWFSLKVPNGFVAVFSSGRVSAYCKNC